jgi:hypothetical protein
VTVRTAPAVRKKGHGCWRVVNVSGGGVRGGAVQAFLESLKEGRNKKRKYAGGDTNATHRRQASRRRGG